MKTILFLLLIVFCNTCYSQQVISRKQYYINKGIVNNYTFSPVSSYDQTYWYKQYAAENPIDPREYSRESNRLLNILQYVRPTSTPPTIEEIRQSIINKIKNF